jgi:hypothetical protein
LVCTSYLILFSGFTILGWCGRTFVAMFLSLRLANKCLQRPVAGSRLFWSATPPFTPAGSIKLGSARLVAWSRPAQGLSVALPPVTPWPVHI